MRFLIIDYTSNKSKIIKAVLKEMNSIQNKLFFEYKKERPYILNDRSGFLYWEDGFNMLGNFLSSNHKNVIGIFEVPIQNNWFSKTKIERGLSLITIADWEIISHLNQESFLVAEITENSLEQIVSYNNYSFTHEPPIGCISDMCVYKSDLNLKILTAYICPSCMEIIKEKVEAEYISNFLSLMDLARNYAFNKLSTETLIEEIINFPVAVYLRKLKGEPDLQNKFNLLLDLFDITTRTSVIFLLSRLNEITKEYQPLIQTKRASLGDWVSCLNDALTKLEHHKDSFFSDFYQDLTAAYEIITSQKLVKLRNDTKGHAFHLPSHEVQDYFQKYHPILLTILKTLSNFLSLKMSQVIKPEYKRRGFELLAYNLNTSNPIFIKEEIKITPTGKFELICKENEIILFNSDLSDYITLRPYLIIADCPTCKQPRLLIFDNAATYIDIQMGHRIKIDKESIA